MIKIKKLHALENIRNTFFEVLPTKFYVLIISLSSQLFLKEEKMQSIDLLTQFLKSMIIVKKNDKKTILIRWANISVNQQVLNM